MTSCSKTILVPIYAFCFHFGCIVCVIQVLETKQKPGVKCIPLDSKHASPNELWALLHLQVGFLSFVILLLSPSQKSPPGECYSLRLSIGSKGSNSSLEKMQVRLWQVFSICMSAWKGICWFERWWLWDLHFFTLVCGDSCLPGQLPSDPAAPKQCCCQGTPLPNNLLTYLRTDSWSSLSPFYF